MVVFTCNVCNESLKKNQVEKHYTTRCRSCNVLTCVDCSKEFVGTEYEQHTKCISESEKYGGKNYVAKPGANKGEAKQEAWCFHVQAAARKASGNHKLKGVLDQVAKHDNVPRKKAKYENFLKNSMRIMDYHLITQSWELISAEIDNQKKQEEEEKLAEAAKENTEKAEDKETSKEEEETSEKKLSKREKKEERQGKEGKKGKTKKKEKQKKSTEEESAACEDVVENGKKKKGKKRKTSKEEDEDSGIEEQEEEPKLKKKKNSAEEETEEAADTSEVPVKFSWEEAILACLKKKRELPLKKLKKKVMTEYHNTGGKIYDSEDRALSRFHKKLLRIPNIKVVKDRVELVDSD